MKHVQHQETCTFQNPLTVKYNKAPPLSALNPLIENLKWLQCILMQHFKFRTFTSQTAKLRPKTATQLD